MVPVGGWHFSKNWFQYPFSPLSNFSFNFIFCWNILAILTCSHVFPSNIWSYVGIPVISLFMFTKFVHSNMWDCDSSSFPPKSHSYESYKPMHSNSYRRALRLPAWYILGWAESGLPIFRGWGMVPSRSHNRQQIYDCVDWVKIDPFMYIQKGGRSPISTSANYAISFTTTT